MEEVMAYTTAREERWGETTASASMHTIAAEQQMVAVIRRPALSYKMPVKNLEPVRASMEMVDMVDIVGMEVLQEEDFQEEDFLVEEDLLEVEEHLEGSK